MAGNGTIGLELVEQLDGIDAVLVPWGGGGLTTGIASALRATSPGTKVFACEPETGAPLSASLKAGKPVEVDYTPSFVDGAGSKSLLAPMWERARPLLTDAFALSLDETAAAVRLLARAGPHRRRRGGSPCRCCCARRPGGRGPDRVHRVRRQHRRRATGDDS